MMPQNSLEERQSSQTKKFLQSTKKRSLYSTKREQTGTQNDKVMQINEGKQLAQYDKLQASQESVKEFK